MLKTGLQNSLNDVTPRLFAKGLISDGIQRRVLSVSIPFDERAIHLMTVLLDRIRIDPPFFKRFCKELHTFPELSVLATRLMEELKQAEEEAAEQQQPHPRPSTCAPVSLCDMSVCEP